jgi:hypothetical protein
MVSERKGVPWYVWAIIGAAGVGGGIYALYKLGTTVFGAGPAAATNELKSWSDEYAKELNAILAQGRLPTQAEEFALKQKQQMIDDAYSKLFIVYGVAAEVIIAGLVTAGLVWLASSVARDYLKTHSVNVKTSASYIQLFRSCEAIDLSEGGNLSLAVALNTQTQTVFNSVYSPLFQTEINTYESSLPTLVGTELVATEELVINLETDMQVTIPNLLLDVTSFLAGA